jgi:hypothetical protein
VARSGIGAARRYVGMRFKGQFNYYIAPVVKNFIATLGDITKRTKKVIPLENRSRIVEPVLHSSR